MNKKDILFRDSPFLYIKTPFNITVKEYRYSEIKEPILGKLNKFYSMLNNREIDKMYTNRVKQFICWYNKKNIVSAVQFINNDITSDGKIPAEHGCKVTDTNKIELFNTNIDLGGNYSIGEVSKLKIDFKAIKRIFTDKNIVKSVFQVTFLAIWLKILKNNISYAYCSAASESKNLRNLYEEKLGFEWITRLKYNNSERLWTLFRKNFNMEKIKGQLYPSHNTYLQDLFLNFNINRMSEQDAATVVHGADSC